MTEEEYLSDDNRDGKMPNSGRCKLRISTQDRVKLTNLDEELLKVLRAAESFDVMGDLSRGDGFCIDLDPPRGVRSLSVGKDDTVFVPHGQSGLKIAKHCEWLYEITDANLILCTVTSREDIDPKLEAYRQLPPNKDLTSKKQMRLFEELSPLGTNRAD